MTSLVSESHYPAVEVASACPILAMLSTHIVSDKYQLFKSWMDLTRTEFSSQTFCIRKHVSTYSYTTFGIVTTYPIALDVCLFVVLHPSDI